MKYRITFRVSTDLEYEELMSELYNILGYMKKKQSIKDHWCLETKVINNIIPTPETSPDLDVSEG